MGSTTVFKSSVELVHQLRELGFKVAVVTSSKNCTETLESVGIKDLFDVQVDGNKSEKLQLKGKPDPDIFLQAAKELQVSPKKAVVFEDALAGVQAGSQGHFGLVVGVDRANQADRLKKEGANSVVKDLSEVEARGS